MEIISRIKTLVNSGSQRSIIVKKNAIASFFIKAFSMLLDFVKIYILLMYLDASRYGVYVTIASIITWTHNFDFGLGSGLRYHLTESISTDNIVRSRNLVSTAYISMLAIMSLVFIICTPIVLCLDWSHILNCDFVGNSDLALCVILVLIVFLTQFVLELISIILQADQKAALSTIFKPLANLTTIGVIIVLSFFSHNSLVLACLAMTVPIVVVLFTVNVYYFYGQYKTIAPSFKSFSRSCIKDIFSLGLKYFVGQLSTLVVFNTATVLITYYIAPEASAIYNTAFTYFGVVVMFNAMILQPIVVAITDAYVLNDTVWMKSVMRKLHLYSIFLTVCAVALFIVSPIVFKIWLGDKLIIPWSLSIMLSLYFILNIWVTPYQYFLTGVGKQSVMMWVSIFKSILYLPIAILLIKSCGLIGIVVAIIVINTLPNLIIGVYQTRLILNNKAFGIWNK